MNLRLDPEVHADCRNDVVMDAFDPQRQKAQTMFTTVPASVANLCSDDLSSTDWDRMVPMCLSDSQFAFEIAHVTPSSGRQVLPKACRHPILTVPAGFHDCDPGQRAAAEVFQR